MAHAGEYRQRCSLGIRFFQPHTVLCGYSNVTYQYEYCLTRGAQAALLSPPPPPLPPSTSLLLVSILVHPLPAGWGA